MKVALVLVLFAAVAYAATMEKRSPRHHGGCHGHHCDDDGGSYNGGCHGHHCNDDGGSRNGGCHGHHCNDNYNNYGYGSGDSRMKRSPRHHPHGGHGSHGSHDSGSGYGSDSN